MRSLLLLLVVSCSTPSEEEQAALFPTSTVPLSFSCSEVDKNKDSREVCLGRLKCTSKNVLLSETFHFCICPSTGCICFATFTKKSYEECISDPENCGGHSSMLFVSPEFCTIPKEKRSWAFLKGLNDVIKADNKSSKSSL